MKKGNTLGKNNYKNIKKLMHEEESDSETEIEESQYTPEEEKDIVQEKKEVNQSSPKRKKKIF